jgi:hypothetical protein
MVHRVHDTDRPSGVEWAKPTKIVLPGTIGMVGQGVLRERLLATDVEGVLAVGLSATGAPHAKLRELVCADLPDLRSIESELQPSDATAPAPLSDAGAFLDKMTGPWRYEFGVPFETNGSRVWGTHRWVPVKHLYLGLTTATRLPMWNSGDIPPLPACS